MDSIDGTYTNNPECKAGKHGNCDGRGWDLTADMPTLCRCMCHHPDPTATCATCGHFFDPEDGELTCSIPCEILRVHDEAQIESDVYGITGGF